MCSERVTRRLADHPVVAMLRADLAGAQRLMEVAFDGARWHRREYEEYLAHPNVNLARDADAVIAFDLLDEVIEARAFARHTRQTVRWLQDEIDRLTA